MNQAQGNCATLLILFFLQFFLQMPRGQGRGGFVRQERQLSLPEGDQRLHLQLQARLHRKRKHRKLRR